jgi:hypothetical protein
MAAISAWQLHQTVGDNRQTVLQLRATTFPCMTATHPCCMNTDDFLASSIASRTNRASR